MTRETGIGEGLTKILIVDDEHDVADALKAGLQMDGFEVDAYYDPIKALAAFSPDIYDLVISDIKMPHMNGFEFVYEIKKIDKDVQVIFLTGYVDLMKEVNKLFTKLNVMDVIQKPIGVRELAQRINALHLGLKASPEGQDEGPARRVPLEGTEHPYATLERVELRDRDTEDSGQDDVEDHQDGPARDHYRQGTEPPRVERSPVYPQPDEQSEEEGEHHRAGSQERREHESPSPQYDDIGHRPS